jgi:hypothetical protein
VYSQLYYASAGASSANRARIRRFLAKAGPTWYLHSTTTMRSVHACSHAWPNTLVLSPKTFEAMTPNYALERSVTALSVRAAGAQKIIALRRVGRAARGPLNADVRCHFRYDSCAALRSVGHLSCALVQHSPSTLLPLLSPPGTVTAWWQIDPMAGIGFVLGLPVFWLWETFAKDRQYSELSFWLLSGVYVLLIYLLLAIAFEKFAALRHKHRDT